MNDLAGFIVLAGRILFVIFPAFISGYGFHLKNAKAAEGYAEAMHFPMPAVAGTFAGVWLIVSSISIAVGIFPELGALMMGVFVTVAAFYFHAYWKLEDADQKQAQLSLFWRNMMMLAACLIMFGFFAAAGPFIPYTLVDPVLTLR